jgi:hypothetical protein
MAVRMSAGCKSICIRPVLVGALFIRGSKQVREIIAAVAQSQLVAFQFYRVLGVTFLVLYAAGQLPGIFALPAGWGDVMVGLTALMAPALRTATMINLSPCGTGWVSVIS